MGWGPKGLDPPLNQDLPGPNYYTPSDDYLSSVVHRSVSFSKDRKKPLFEDKIDKEIPGPIYTPSHNYLGKTFL